MRSFPYPPSQFWTEGFDQSDDGESVVAALAEDEYHGGAAGLVTPSRPRHLAY